MSYLANAVTKVARPLKYDRNAELSRGEPVCIIVDSQSSKLFTLGRSKRRRTLTEIDYRRCPASLERVQVVAEIAVAYRSAMSVETADGALKSSSFHLSYSGPCQPS